MEDKIEIITSLRIKDIEYAIINNMTDDNVEQIADMALNFGGEGDLTYELILLKKIINLSLKVYPLDSTGDIEMLELNTKLKECLPLIDKML